MKKVLQHNWIVKGFLVIFMVLASFSLKAQLMLAHEGHHAGHGGCQVKTGSFVVTVSVYEVPEGNIPPMHSYCNHVPNPGKVNVTIELPSDAREIPLAVRLVKDDSHAGHGGSAAQSNAAEKIQNKGDDEEGHVHHHDETHGAGEFGLQYMPPMEHHSGIIVVAAELAELGQYVIQLESIDDKGDVRIVSKVPVHVGGDGGHAGHGSGFGLMEIVVGLMLAVGGIGAFVFRKKKPQAS